jgi:hypothetical protein
MAANASTQSSDAGSGVFSSWYASPFKSGMNALNWALFVGFIMIVAFLWTRVLNHIVE